MKSAGVFLGGLSTVLATNLMLIGVCSSAPSGPNPTPTAAPPTPPPPPAPIVKIIPKPVEAIAPEPVPFGTFLWGCGGHRWEDPDGAFSLPICAPMLKL